MRSWKGVRLDTSADSDESVMVIGADWRREGEMRQRPGITKEGANGGEAVIVIRQAGKRWLISLDGGTVTGTEL